MIKIMVSNGTVFFTFVGVIMFFIAYKLTPFLRHHLDSKFRNKAKLGNMSVLDNLFQSQHKYEIRDCFITDVRCKSDDECRLICTEKLPWYCDNVCKLKDSGEDLLCENGVIKMVYDFENNKNKKVCVCKSPLYYGENCSNTVAHCDTVTDNKCVCSPENIHFLWYIEEGAYDICVPKSEYKLFSNQDNFKQMN